MLRTRCWTSSWCDFRWLRFISRTIFCLYHSESIRSAIRFVVCLKLSFVSVVEIAFRKLDKGEWLARALISPAVNELFNLPQRLYRNRFLSNSFLYRRLLILSATLMRLSVWDDLHRSFCLPEPEKTLKFLFSNAPIISTLNWKFYDSWTSWLTDGQF